MALPIYSRKLGAGAPLLLLLHGLGANAEVYP